MKISQEEIDAARYACSIATVSETLVMLTAAYTVRKARKAAKRKRIELPDGVEMGQFKPCAAQYEEAGVTEIVLEDCFTVWVQHDGVELGYNNEGKLIAVKVWGLVAQRKEKDARVQDSAKAVSFADFCEGGDESFADKHHRAKAPEWDGKFGIGEWETRDGRKAIVDKIETYHLEGTLNRYPFAWNTDGSLSSEYVNHELIRPWKDRASLTVMPLEPDETGATG